jgi:hypothetical protein
MGAEAFATGDQVAFGAAPDLHTAAHEAAHVVQQRQGVQLKGGVGEVGDAYEPVRSTPGSRRRWRSCCRRRPRAGAA